MDLAKRKEKTGCDVRNATISCTLYVCCQRGREGGGGKVSQL